MIACGAYTLDSFYATNPSVMVVQTETFCFSGDKKLLPRFIAESTKDKNVYKLLDGLDLTDYTFGVHGESNLKEAIGWSR